MSVETLPPEILTHTLGQLKPEELARVLSTSESLRACCTEALAAMPPPKKFRIELVSGDASGDGHGNSTSFLIMSNLDEGELAGAYRKGVEVLGFDVQSWSNFDADTEGKMLPQEACKKFEERGFDLSGWIGDEEIDDSDRVLVDCYQKDLPKLWLFTAKLGAPQFEYEFASNRSIDPVDGQRRYVPSAGGIDLNLNRVRDEEYGHGSYFDDIGAQHFDDLAGDGESHYGAIHQLGNAALTTQLVFDTGFGSETDYVIGPYEEGEHQVYDARAGRWKIDAAAYVDLPAPDLNRNPNPPPNRFGETMARVLGVMSIPDKATAAAAFASFALYPSFVVAGRAVNQIREDVADLRTYVREQMGTQSRKADEVGSVAQEPSAQERSQRYHEDATSRSYQIKDI